MWILILKIVLKTTRLESNQCLVLIKALLTEILAISNRPCLFIFQLAVCESICILVFFNYITSRLDFLYIYNVDLFGLNKNGNHSFDGLQC